MPLPIVITGGPCGGKTTIIAWLARRLRRKGFKVVLIPEAARLAISVLGPPRTAREKFELQTLIVRMQLAMEDAAMALARTQTVLIEDRGILDAKAYLPPTQWRVLRRRLGLTEAGLRRRYAAVIHLTSCAVDKPDCYQRDDQRHETVHAARRIDRDIRKSWRGHAVRIEIDNRDKDLRRKREEVLRTVLRLEERLPPSD